MLIEFTPERIKRKGFSLIELVVVLVIMGLVAGLASQSLRGVSTRKKLADAAAQVQAFDTAIRRAALTSRRPVVGVIDRAKRRLQVRADEQRDFPLPKGVTIGRVDLSGANSRQVVVQPDGSSVSYAIRMDADDISRWVIVAGGSGQVSSHLDEQAKQSVFNIR